MKLYTVNKGTGKAFKGFSEPLYVSEVNVNSLWRMLTYSMLCVLSMASFVH